MNIYLLLSLAAFCVSFLIGMLATPMILNFCKEHNLYDEPGGRKVHNTQVPRLGGVSFIPSMFVAFFAMVCVLAYHGGETVEMSIWSINFFVGLMIIYLTGIIDDIAGLKPKTKFLAQIVAASILPLSNLYYNNLYGLLGIHEIPFWVGAPLTVFVTVFICNAMNLIDGIDGLCAGLSLLSLSGFFLSFAHENLWFYAILIAGLMGVLVSFLYFNLLGDVKKNRKIFMGDSGSLSLGFILAFLGVKYAMDNQYVMNFRHNGLLLGYTLLIVPCFDVVRVSLVRLMSHKPIFTADKNHIHHKLMRCGLSQRQTLVVILLLSLSFTLLNTVLAHLHVYLSVIVLIDIVVWMAFHWLVNRKISTF